MEYFLTCYYDPFTGSLIIQLATIGLISLGVSFRRWRNKLLGCFGFSLKNEEKKDE